MYRIKKKKVCPLLFLHPPALTQFSAATASIWCIALTGRLLALFDLPIFF